MAGYKVRSFASIREFLDAFNPKLSGCVILDVMSIQWDEDLREELKLHRANLPIIVLTSNDNLVIWKKAQEINTVGFFSKPFKGMTLLNPIQFV